MSDFLSRLVQRTISDRSMLMPRQESVFEQAIEHSESMPGLGVPAIKEPVRPTATRKAENSQPLEEISDPARQNEALGVPNIDVGQAIDSDPQILDSPPKAQEQRVDSPANMPSDQTERSVEERNEEEIPKEREREAPSTSIEKKESQPDPLVERIPIVVEKESTKPVFITSERRETIREKLEARDREPSISIRPPEKTSAPMLPTVTQDTEEASDVPHLEVETLEVAVDDSSEYRETKRSVEKSKARQAAAPVSDIRHSEAFSAPDFSANRQLRNSRATAQPLIEISIGSIDIKAENRVVKNQIPVRSKPTPRMGIDDYLKKRRESLK